MMSSGLQRMVEITLYGLSSMYSQMYPGSVALFMFNEIVWHQSLKNQDILRQGSFGISFYNSVMCIQLTISCGG